MFKVLVTEYIHLYVQSVDNRIYLFVYLKHWLQNESNRVFKALISEYIVIRMGKVLVTKCCAVQSNSKYLDKRGANRGTIDKNPVNCT